MPNTENLVLEVISSWRAGHQPDARGFFSSHPSMGQQKSTVLDLAYEEYCLRRQAGEQLSPSTFCDKFPTFRRSLARLIEVHEFLESHPQVATLAENIKWPSPGERLLGFDLVRELGRGAFSRVFLARQPELADRPVVVKLTWTGPNEAQTQAKLGHRNVVPVYSVQHDSASGLTLVCMPYLGEATLEDLLSAVDSKDDRPASGEVILKTGRSMCFETPAQQLSDQSTISRLSYVDAIVNLAIQLADALAYLHARGIFHCDLKPSNVLLAGDGAPMLLDFNLSADSMATGSRVGGTLPYMSPEQIRSVFFADEGHTSIDERSDIYSLGVVLYQLLCGELPFSDSDDRSRDAKAARTILERQRIGTGSISGINREAHPKLAQLIGQCLKFDADQRPQSAAALADSLRRYQSKKNQLYRWIAKRRRTLLTATIALAIGLGALGYRMATRPPFSVRAFEAGLVSYEHGDFQGAIDQFNASAAANGNSAEMLFARGMSNVQLKDYEAATNDFLAAKKKSKQGVTSAMLAYCYAIRGMNPNAVFHSHDAIDAKYENAAVMNNLGYVDSRLNQFDAAIEELNRAIALDGRMAQAYLVRATVELQKARQKSELPNAALSDLEQAITLAPKNPHFEYHAACIYAASSRQNPGYRQLALDHLARAVELGVRLDDVSISSFSGFKGEKRYEDCVAASARNLKFQLVPPVVLPAASARLE